MSAWLYQLNQAQWRPEIFRRDVWEGQLWHFSHGQRRGETDPAPGDTVVFFYARAGGSDPGIYGWGIIDRVEPRDEPETLYFIPSAPTNHLKMDPWWDEEVLELTNQIRGQMMAATLFQIVQMP